MDINQLAFISTSEYIYNSLALGLYQKCKAILLSTEQNNHAGRTGSLPQIPIPLAYIPTMNP